MEAERALITPEKQNEPISAEKWQALQQEVRDYKKLEKSAMSRMFEDKSQQFYLLSVKFLEQWKLYAGFHLPETHYPELVTASPPDPYNYDLLEANDPTKYVVADEKSSEYQHMLKKEVVENVHFIVVNEAVMRLFKNYKGVAISRRFVPTLKGTQILQRKFMRVSFFVVGKSIAKKVAAGRVKLDVAVAETSLFADVATWRANIQSYWLSKYCSHILKDPLAGQTDTANFRIWLFQSIVDFQEIASLFKADDPTKALKSSNVKRPRELVDDKKRSKVSDLQISENSLLMLELSEAGKFLLDALQAKDSNRCLFCGDVRVNTFECRCQEALYCSKICLERDAKSDHLYNCRVFQSENLVLNFDSQSLRGKVGLANLGNTCYMNASLQCMSNSFALTKFFCSNNIEAAINPQNPIGHRGRLINSYLHTLKNLWCGNKDSFRAEYLKKLIGEANQMFAGTNQHDAQEFLLTLLDALHEEMNVANLQPKQQLPALKGSDLDLSRASWQHYIARNQSPVIDLFAGQYKSSLRCLHCKHESVTFESFFTLPLPIYTKDPISFYFLGYNRPEFYSLVKLELEDPTIDKITTQFARMLGKDYSPRRLKFFLLDNKIADISNLHYDQLSEVMRKQSLYCIELSEEEEKLYTPEADSLNKLNIYFARSQKSSANRIPISRPFWFPFAKITVRDIQEHVWRWMFRAVVIKKGNEDFGVNFAKNFVKSDTAPLRLFLKVRDVQGNVKYHKEKQQLAQKDQLRLIHANYPIMSKFELECNVDYLTPACDDQQFGYYRQFRKTMMEVEEAQATRLESCFDKFRKPQILQDSNQWLCPKCNVRRDAEKLMSLYKTSKYLIVHLKRFKQKSDYRKVKVTSLVEFPVRLDLKDHLTQLGCPMDDFESKLRLPLEVNRSKASFRLYGVINHIGALGGGHYTAYAYNNQAWRLYDDSICRQVNEEDVCTKDAYVLFYQRE